MPKTLVSWSDRGVAGSKPSHHGTRPKTDRGPVMRLVEESECTYDKAIIVATKAGESAAQELVDELREQLREVELITLPLDDPSDYSALFSALQPATRHQMR